MSIEAINAQAQPVHQIPQFKPVVQAEVVVEAVKTQPNPIPETHQTEIDRNPGFSVDEVKGKIAELNQVLKAGNHGVAFSTDAGTGHKVVTVSNLSTGELIRQMPSVEILKAMQNMDHMMGLIFSERT
jgi:flagellar protein FlaG